MSMSKGRIIFICILLITLAACSSPEEKKAKHMERGLKYYNEGKYNEAIIEYKNAVQITPKDAEGHYRLGIAFIRTGKIHDLSNAYKELSQAVEINPDIMDAQVQLGNILLLSREYSEAKEKADIVLKKETGNVDAHLLLG